MIEKSLNLKMTHPYLLKLISTVKVLMVFVVFATLTACSSSSNKTTNAKPVATFTQLSVTQDTIYTGILTASDSDNDTLTFVKLTDPSNGVLSLSSNGNFTYTPNVNYYGTDSFTYRVNDTKDNSPTVSVSITVISTNIKPVGTFTSFTMNEDTTYTGTLTASDEDNDTLTFLIDSNATNANIVLDSNGSFTYTPNADYFGNDTFTYKVNDTKDDSNATTVTITVNNINDQPVATFTTFSVNEDIEYTGKLTATDKDNDNLTYIIIGQPTNHQKFFATQDGTFNYKPKENYDGTDTFLYKVNDGQVDSNTTEVSITVVFQNDDSPVIDTTFSTLNMDINTKNTLTVDINISHNDNDELTLNIDSNDTNLTVTPSSRIIAYGIYNSSTPLNFTVSNKNYTTSRTSKINIFLSDGDENVTTSFDVNITKEDVFNIAKYSTEQNTSYVQYDDANLTRGKDRNYTRTSDIVTDTTTGLMWQDDINVTNSISFNNLDDANTSCNSLTLGGFSNWKLPTMFELYSILIKDENIKINSIFVNKDNNKYWTSSILGNEAWFVDFNSTANTTTLSKSDKIDVNSVRCVRSLND